MKEKQSELKSCPFCGNEGHLLEWKRGKLRYVIGCTNPMCVFFLPFDVKWKERMNYTSGVWRIKEELIKAWNRRA